MYYVINKSDLPDDIYEEIDRYGPPLVGPCIYIHKESLEVIRGYNLMLSGSETIDVEKLKEILLIKHLKD